jgi:hypothetical protein
MTHDVVWQDRWTSRYAGDVSYLVEDTVLQELLQISEALVHVEP